MTRLEKIEALLADEPNDQELLYMLAMEHVSLGDDSTAVLCFERLMQVVPNYPPAYHQAGRALQRLNRVAEAREVLAKGISVALASGDRHAAEEMQALSDMLD